MPTENLVPAMLLNSIVPCSSVQAHELNVNTDKYVRKRKDNAKKPQATKNKKRSE